MPSSIRPVKLNARSLLHETPSIAATPAANLHRPRLPRRNPHQQEIARLHLPLRTSSPPPHRQPFPLRSPPRPRSRPRRPYQFQVQTVVTNHPRTPSSLLSRTCTSASAVPLPPILYSEISRVAPHRVTKSTRIRIASSSFWCFCVFRTPLRRAKEGLPLRFREEEERDKRNRFPCSGVWQLSCIPAAVRAG